MVVVVGMQAGVLALRVSGVESFYLSVVSYTLVWLFLYLF